MDIKKNPKVNIQGAEDKEQKEERLTRSEKQFLKSIEEEIGLVLKTSTGILVKKTNIVLGLSGGPDSIFMLNILKKYYKKHIEEGHVVIHVMHLNHNIRGEEALRDEQFVKTLVEKDKYIIGHIYSENIIEDAQKLSESVETYARRRRYELLDNIANNIQKEDPNSNIYIVTAHNATDNAETIFMNIFRGSGKTGLMGLIVKTKLSEYTKHIVLRPMIGITKKDVLKYLELAKIEYVIDSTNAQNIYTRNKVRNVIFPYITEELGYNPEKALRTLSKLMREEETFLRKTIKEKLKKAIIHVETNAVFVDASKVKEEDPYVAKRMIIGAILLLLKTSRNITNTNIEDIYKLINENKVGKKLQPNKEIIISIERNGKNKTCVFRTTNKK